MNDGDGVAAQARAHSCTLPAGCAHRPTCRRQGGTVGANKLNTCARVTTLMQARRLTSPVCLTPTRRKCCRKETPHQPAQVLSTPHGRTLHNRLRRSAIPSHQLPPAAKQPSPTEPHSRMLPQQPLVTPWAAPHSTHSTASAHARTPGNPAIQTPHREHHRPPACQASGRRRDAAVTSRLLWCNLAIGPGAPPPFCAHAPCPNTHAQTTMPAPFPASQ